MKKKRWKAKEIKALRGAMDLTQTAFASRLGVTQNYIYLLESGRKTPSETLKLLLECVERSE
jgi:DNA-binding transcriptional regulator YiaG